MSGEGLPFVGRPLGYRCHRTTAGYTHLADAHPAEAADRVGSLIAEAIYGAHQWGFEIRFH